MKYLGQNELGQEVFHNQPPEVDWAGVDYDGELNFGIAINPRYTWASEVWRGYEKIGESVENSGYKALTQVMRINQPQDLVETKQSITLEDLKDFDVWKSWKHDEVTLEPFYTEKEVDRILDTQRGNSFVAVLDKTNDTKISSLASNAPEPWGWRKSKKQ